MIERSLLKIPSSRRAPFATCHAAFVVVVAATMSGVGTGVRIVRGAAAEQFS